MKENKNNQLENFTDHIMKGTALESPSADFTSKVMFHALAAPKSNVTIYKPLISKSVFAGIFGCFVAAFICLPDNATPQANRWLSDIYSILMGNQTHLFAFEFSEIATYAVVFATLVLFVQIFLLKQHFERQIEKYNMNS
jgi:hypothetical protein